MKILQDFQVKGGNGYGAAGVITPTEITRELGALAGGIFVPTMGALHEGHQSLIRQAIALAKAKSLRAPVVVSVFVNPTQFNERADFDRYPRELATDARMCEEAGADFVFAPSEQLVYPPGDAPAVPELPRVATAPRLEDAHRPGHFAGVCQVCARLFALVKPSTAIFGEKDWQQLAAIRAMVAQMGLGIEIVPGLTVREEDGLAMSSRNARLTPNLRRRAPALARALAEASKHATAEDGERAGRRVLLASRIVPEYFVIRDAVTLEAPAEGRPARALVAARLAPEGAGGAEVGVRLIDNAPWPGFAL